MSKSGDEGNATFAGPKSDAVLGRFGWAFGLLAVAFGLTSFLAGMPRVGWALLISGLLLLPLAAKALGSMVPIFRQPMVPGLTAVAVGVILLIVNPFARAGRGGQSDDVKAEVNAAWSELSRITQPCDAAAGVFSKALESGSAGSVTAYRVANQAKSICANAGLDVLGVSVPKGLSDPHRKAFRDALAGCGAAYAGRSVMYGEMMKVLDGDRRPSQLARVQTAADTSQNEVVKCGLNVISVADRAGIKLASPNASPPD